MRHEAIKKRSGQWVRIRPALQVYDGSAVLRDTIEDAWLVSEITEDSLKLQSRDTHHSRVVGLDHVHNYMEDPEGERTLGTTGMLVMNVQLLLFEDALLTEPVAPPGTPLKVFVPARPRADLLGAAAKMRAQAELEKAREQFAWSIDGVNSSDRAFAEFPAALASLSEELINAGQPVEMKVGKIYGNGLLVAVAGWWVTLFWERMAANCIKDSCLTVTTYDGPPKLPNMIVFESPRKVSVEKYTYGLAALNEPRWLSASNTALNWTTISLAQQLLTKLLEHPNGRRR